MKQPKRGVTFVELLIVIALLGITALFTVQLFLATASAQEQSAERYDIQNSVRIATSYTDRIINEASVIFTIQEDRFFEANLTPFWDYFGLSEDKSEVIRYVYDESVPGHRREVLVPAKPGITYSIDFYKPINSEDNYIGYRLIAYKDGAVWSDVDVDTALEAKNALQVVFRGTALQRTTALAFRVNQRPDQDVYGLVTFVMDNSGSMQTMLNGTYTTGSKARIALVKKAMGTLLGRLLTREKIMVSLIPFASTANYPNVNSTNNQSHPIYSSDVSSDLARANNQANAMTANGWTNTGDGLRRGYYSLNEMRALKNGSKYMIVLVDGYSTASSHRRSGSSVIYFNDEGPYIYGKGGWLNPASDKSYESGGARPKSKGYVNEWTRRIRESGVTCFVIGFSQKANELADLEEIARGLGIDPVSELNSRYFRFTESGTNLEAVFTQIETYIMDDLWHIRGPNL